MQAAMDSDNDFEDKTFKRKINIFDDKVTIDAAREVFKSNLINSDDDDEDEINFDGTPVVKISNRPGAPASKTPMPDLSTLAVPATSSTLHKPTVTGSSQNDSYIPFGSVSNAVTYNQNRSKNLTTGSLNVSKSTTSYTGRPSDSSWQDIDDTIGGSIKKQVSVEDVNKMQQEIQSLKRSLLSARADKWIKLPIDNTLKRIIKGEDFSLELYKSLEDKLDLLDKAVQQHDGNAITTAVLFLQKTVVKSIFNRELQSRPVAANHYLNYLKAHYDHTDYINTLLLLGRHEEAAIFKCKLAIQTSDVSVKISKLKDSLRSNFQANSSLAADSSFVQDYVDLLERQRPIDEADAHAEASGKSLLFHDFPRKRSLIDMPVVTTLYYCCLYHYNLTESSLASPEAIRKRHQISDKQFTWTAISARAKLRQWNDIETLLTTKGWFGGTKLKTIIGFEKIVGILHKNNAPPDILEKYLSLTDDLEMRLNLAKKVECSKSVIDTLVAMRNRPELEAFTLKLDRYSKDGLYAHDILNSSAIKWK